MGLANMRSLGVRSIFATSDCGKRRCRCFGAAMRCAGGYAARREGRGQWMSGRTGDRPHGARH